MHLKDLKSPNVRALILCGVSLPEEVGQASLHFTLYYSDLSLSWWGFGKDFVDSGFHYFNASFLPEIIHWFISNYNHLQT